MKKGIFWLLIACTTSSCAFLFGAREPKKETVASIYKYYQRKHIDTSKVIFLIPMYLDSLKLQSSKGMEVGFRPIQFRLFAPDGSIAAQHISCEGFLKQFDILETFPPRNLMPIDSFLNLHDELKMVDMGIKKIEPKPGYSLFIYSQVWTGKFGTNYVNNLLAYSQEHHIANVYVFNTDER